MPEKSGTIVLTEDEVRLVKSGKLPARLAVDWGLTLEQASEIINSDGFTPQRGGSPQADRL